MKSIVMRYKGLLLIALLLSTVAAQTVASAHVHLDEHPAHHCELCSSSANLTSGCVAPAGFSVEFVSPAVRLCEQARVVTRSSQGAFHARAPPFFLL